MANILQLENFKPESLIYPAELINDINELMHEAIVTGGPIERFHTVFTGIKGKTQIGFVGEMGLVGIKRQGCDPDRQSATIPVDDKFLDPQRYEASFVQCYEELLETIALYAMKLKNDEPDLENTAYWNMVRDKFTTALDKMLWRIIWFGDTTAKNVTDGGQITDGVELKYFTWLNGLWKQIFEVATTNPSRRIAIAANEAADIDAANAALTSEDVKSICSQLKYKADIRLRSSTLINGSVQSTENNDALFVMCTRAFSDKIEQMLLEQPAYTESQYKINEAGLQYIRYNGLDFYPIDIWDEIIQKYQSSTVGGKTKLNLPYRAVLTKKSNLVVAVPGTDAFARIDVWYDKTSRKNYMEAMDALDTTYMREYLFEVAY